MDVVCEVFFFLEILTFDGNVNQKCPFKTYPKKKQKKKKLGKGKKKKVGEKSKNELKPFLFNSKRDVENFCCFFAVEVNK